MIVRVYNMGGITEPLELSLEKGVNVYKAPNSYGKTSLSKSMLSLLTSSLKPEDLLNAFADSGYVEIEMNGKTYYRRIKRIKDRFTEDSKLIINDDRALLLSYFSPENKLLNQILAGEENVEWFISATSKIAEIRARKDELDSKLEQLKKEMENLDKKYEEAIDLQTKIRQLDSEISKLETEKENSKVLNKATITITTTRNNKLYDLQERIESRKRDLKDVQLRLDKIEQEIKQKESMVSSEIRKSYEAQLSQINQELQSKASLRNNLDIEIKLLEKVLDQIKESEKQQLSTCYVCGSHVEPSTWRVRVDVISSELNEKKNNYTSIKNEIAELDQKKAEIEKRLKDLDQMENDIRKLRMVREELQDKIANISGQISDLERQKREMEERFNRSSAEVVMPIESKDPILERIEELKKKKENYEYELMSIGIPNSILEKLDEKKKEIEGLQAEVESLQKEYIRRLTAARDEFVRASNYLLRQLDFNIEAKIDEKYRLVVMRKGAELDLKKLSSSERTTLALILIVTAMKSYFKTPFFLVDESFMTFDQKRFGILTNYLSGITEYIIITKSDERAEITKETTVPQVSS
ncbi:archaea-specific SMC-related protein [Acidianus sp. RZ1]|uniref:archaea-specific SMC-related protein n=1 Tax=Acidianus sp. RZ1 TaxID=1540082 RepID=UPI0014910FA8|nr:archaea-specific SMC-related protein [Acidianus sp. RZ1]NON62277.1 hypothetical protein [Acidianus sp. RZ1]